MNEEQDPVVWAQERLEEHYRTLDAIGPYQSELDLADLLEELGELKVAFHRGDTSEARYATNIGEYELELAWRRGIAVDGSNIGPISPYLRRLETLKARAGEDPLAAESLDLHAKSYLFSGQAIPIGLRAYIADRLDGLKPARNRGGQRLSELRDHMLAYVMEEVVSKFGLFAYGSAKNDFEASACRVVAKAQLKLGRHPNSPRPLARILQSARRAAKAEEA
jgi:hypothetical protein